MERSALRMILVMPARFGNAVSTQQRSVRPHVRFETETLYSQVGDFEQQGLA